MYIFFFLWKLKLFFIGGVKIYVVYFVFGLVLNLNKNNVFVYI